MAQSTRKEKWQYMQAICSLQSSVEEFESIENMMTVSNKFLRILKLSFKIMNTNYDSDEEQENVIKALEVKMDNSFYHVIDSQESRFDDCVILALSYLYASYVCIDEKAKIHNSKNFLMKSLELLKERELDRKAILIAMRVLNELSYIDLQMENVIDSQAHLNKALQLYLMFTKDKDDYPVPIDVASILSVEDKMSSKFLLQRIYLTTLEGLLELDDISSDPQREEISEAVICMHKVLKKDLDLTNLDYIEWATNSAILSTYFTKYDRFTEARNHLAAATFIVQRFFATALLETEEKNSALKTITQTRYCYISAITAMYWAKYGLALMKSSKERAIIREENKFSEASSSQSNDLECSATIEMQTKDLLVFLDIEEDLAEFTAPITDKCPLNYEEAKRVFVSVLNWFNDVKTYTMKAMLKDEIIDEYSVAIGISTAYRYLACYEQDKSKRIKLYKRQVEVINKVIETSKPTVGSTIYEELYTELIFSHSTMLDIMTEHLRADNDKLTEEESLEVKQHVTNCLKNLKIYLNN